MRKPTPAQEAVQKQFKVLERKDSRWKSSYMNPDEDLKNVLAGYHARDGGVARDLKSIENRHALPTVGRDIDDTAVGILLQQNMTYLENRFSGNRVLNTRIAEMDIHDSKNVADLYSKLLKASPSDSRVGEMVFKRVAQYLVLKNRLAYSREHPIQPASSDSPQQIQDKVSQQNTAFFQHIRELNISINKELQPSSRPIRGSVLTDMARYTNQAFTVAAKYEGRFKAQKQSLLEHTNETVRIMQQMEPSKEVERLKAKYDQAELELAPILDQQKAGTPERTALKWSLTHTHLEAVARQTKSQSDVQALNAHRSNRPTTLDDPKSDISQAIAPQLQEARPILIRMTDTMVQRVKVSHTELAFKAFERDADLKDLCLQLDTMKEDLVDNHLFNEDALQDHIYATHLRSIRDVHPTKENQANLEAFAQATILDPNEDPADDHPEILNLARRIGELEAQNQQVDPSVKTQPAYRIAKARSEYQDALSQSDGAIRENNNPNPEALANLQLGMNALRTEYKKTVVEAHKEAGTDKVLAKLSAPLDVLRNNPRGNVMATLHYNTPSFMQRTLPQPVYKQEAARLPVLDPHKYELSGTELPGVLVRIDTETNAVNALLAKREQLERVIEANPELAKDPSYLKEISENDSKLQAQMTELTRHTKLAEKGLLQTHPDVQEWAEKASRLQDAVNRQEFFERHHRFNKVAGINPNIKHDPAVAGASDKKGATTYFEKVGPDKWRLRTHKAKIKVPQADGSEKEVMENIEFSTLEIKGLFADFCEMHGNLEKSVKITEKNGKITYRWPNEEYKKEWLKFLEEKYVAKRTKELKTQKPEAEATIQTPGNKSGAISASQPAPPPVSSSSPALLSQPAPVSPSASPLEKDESSPPPIPSF